MQLPLVALYEKLHLAKLHYVNLHCNYILFKYLTKWKNTNIIDINTYKCFLKYSYEAIGNISQLSKVLGNLSSFPKPQTWDCWKNVKTNYLDTYPHSSKHCSNWKKSTRINRGKNIHQLFLQSLSEMPWEFLFVQDMVSFS